LLGRRSSVRLITRKDLPTCASGRIEAEREPAREQILAFLLDRVVAHTLNVAKQPLEANFAEEAGAAGGFHGFLDGGDAGARGEILVEINAVRERDRRLEVVVGAKAHHAVDRQ